MVYAPVRSIIPSLKLGVYPSVQAHKPCSISYLNGENSHIEHCSRNKFHIIFETVTTTMADIGRLKKTKHILFFPFAYLNLYSTDI